MDKPSKVFLEFGFFSSPSLLVSTPPFVFYLISPNDGSLPSFFFFFFFSPFFESHLR